MGSPQRPVEAAAGLRTQPALSIGRASWRVGHVVARPPPLSILLAASAPGTGGSAPYAACTSDPWPRAAHGAPPRVRGATQTACRAGLHPPCSWSDCAVPSAGSHAHGGSALHASALAPRAAGGPRHAGQAARCPGPRLPGRQEVPPGRPHVRGGAVQLHAGLRQAGKLHDGGPLGSDSTVWSWVSLPRCWWWGMGRWWSYSGSRSAVVLWSIGSTANLCSHVGHPCS
jgi:hypothetical protein